MTETAENMRRRMQFFYQRESRPLDPEMMPREGVDASVLAGIAKLAAVNVVEGLGERSRVLFSGPGDKDMSLIHIWFKSGYVLPYHSHDVDCLYYVIGGELRMGSRGLHKGDGVFIPAHQSYGYEAGPAGVEVLEFRNASRFNFLFGGNDESRWDRIVSIYRDRAKIWATETVPPSDNGH